MFNRKDLTVIDWWIFFFVMVIPFVNLIVILVLLVSEGTNKTLKNYLLASILPVIIIVILWFVFIAALFVDMT